MRLLRFFFCCFLLFSPVLSGAQEKYWAFLTDKKGSTFDPCQYFDNKALERRELEGLPLADSTDFPLNEEYLLQITALADSVSHHSRWFNALAVYASDEKAERIRALPFVKAVVPMCRLSLQLCEKQKPLYKITLSPNNQNLLKSQLARMGAASFRKSNLDGRGIRIAVLDAGFPTVDVNPAFKDIRKENRIKGTYDFVKRSKNVYGHNAHGTMVLSCIAGVIGDKQIGMATGAEFLLARTENAIYEPFSEEENWLAAVEWADKNGANIINSSLGYTFRRYFPEDMNGRTSLIARAANMAARKGILVVNAAGNDGDNSWKKLGTPGDADSALTIGGIDPRMNYHIYFSSYGPASDGRLKPNVCAYGEAVVAGKSGLENESGTSFSTPLTAGFAACAWQASRGLKCMELFHELEHSGDLFPYFDYAHGYGVPQAEYFTDKERKGSQPTFDLVKEDGVLKVVIKDASYKRKTAVQIPGQLDTTTMVFSTQPPLYYHIQNTKGYLDEYYVISVDQQNPKSFRFDEFAKGKKLRVYYKGYTLEYTF